MTTVLLVFWLLKHRVNKVLILVFAFVYMAIELGFFSANVIKFMEGGWITVVLAGSIGICMYAWYNGRSIKQNLSNLLSLRNIFRSLKI
jgi:KUP system potassium uptake protein